MTAPSCRRLALFSLGAVSSDSVCWVPPPSCFPYTLMDFHNYMMKQEQKFWCPLRTPRNHLGQASTITQVRFYYPCKWWYNWNPEKLRKMPRDGKHLFPMLTPSPLPMPRADILNQSHYSFSLERKKASHHSSLAANTNLSELTLKTCLPSWHVLRL